MIPRHLIDSEEDRTQFLERLNIRKKAHQIAEILLFFKRLFNGKYCQILESHWRVAVNIIEHYLMRDRLDLAEVHIGLHELREPRSIFVHVIHDLEF